MSSYVKMWKNAFNFTGRTTRKDFWCASLVNILIMSVFVILMWICGYKEVLANNTTVGYKPPVQYIIVLVIYCLYCLSALIPSISLSIRRLHDIGKSGWWYLICTILYCCGVGPIILLVFMCIGSKSDNQWGPNPYGVAGDM